jgi:hypothetical protein
VTSATAGEPRSRTRSLTVHAARQHGLFTVEQARAAGFTDGAVKYRIRAGVWTAVDYGVYAIAGTPSSWLRRLLAACLAGPAVASHRSAAALWNFPGFGRSIVEVTSIRHRRRHRTDVVWHESRLLGRRDTSELEGVPVTDAARTIIDLAAVSDDGNVLEALDDAVRRRLTSVPLITVRLDRLGAQRTGNARIRRLLARRPPSTSVPQSVLETRFDILLLGTALPKPVPQYGLRDAHGTLVARVDFAYPSARLAIEIDGLRFHGGPGDWSADLTRQNDITALGWRVLRFTATDLELRPRDVAARIRRALGSSMRT